MNTSNNRRRQNSAKLIKKATLSLINKHNGDIELTPSLIVASAKINRATLYNNFPNIDSIITAIYNDHLAKFDNTPHTVKEMLTFFKENAAFFRYYLDNYPTNTIIDDFIGPQPKVHSRFAKYFSAFDKAGAVAVIHLWLKSDCEELIRTICNIIIAKYNITEYPAKMLTFYFVELHSDYRSANTHAYTYLARPHDKYYQGEEVLVPVGPEDRLVVGVIRKVATLPAEESPYPLDKIKYIEDRARILYLD